MCESVVPEGVVVLRARLVDRLVEVMGKQGRTKNQVRDSKAPLGGDSADHADSTLIQFVAVALNGNHCSEGQDIARAIQKIDDGTYGNCEGCGEPINAGRLKAYPWMRFCVPCQSRHESSGRHHGREPANVFADECEPDVRYQGA